MNITHQIIDPSHHLRFFSFQKHPWFLTLTNLVIFRGSWGSNRCRTCSSRVSMHTHFRKYVLKELWALSALKRPPLFDFMALFLQGWCWLGLASIDFVALVNRCFCGFSQGLLMCMLVATQAAKTSSLRPIHPHLKPLIRAALDAGAHGASGAPGGQNQHGANWWVQIGPDGCFFVRQNS